MESVRQLDAGLWDQVDAYRSISAELARFQDLHLLSERAVELILDGTRSSVAFIGLIDELGGHQVFARAADPSLAVPHEEIEQLLTATAAGVSPVANTLELSWDGPADPRLSFSCGQPLWAGGRMMGLLGVANEAGYSAVERRAFPILANQLAAAIEMARLHERRQELVDALVNLRADLDRSEKGRLVTEERARSAERVERAHELAVEALIAVSVHAGSGHNLTDFYRGLTATVAELVGADKVLFWELNDNKTVTAIPGAYGIDDAFIARLYPAPCDPASDDLTSQVVFKDLIFRAARSDDEPLSSRVLDALGVGTAISVPWRAGDHRLGLVAAYDSRQPEGFSREDTWVLQKAALAAGLVWQLKQAETDLKTTVQRLEKVDAARRLLLKNVSTAVESARRRFATELHDDALQKLTAAELQLQRVTERAGPGGETPVSQAQLLLAQAEDALRRLLFEVSPPALDVPGGLGQTVLDRVAMLRSLTGIEAEVDLDLPDELPIELRSTIFRQVAEALTNIEKHAAATRVHIEIKELEGGIHGEVVDDGCGFVVEERNHLPGHLGLLALAERALLAGGWCKVASEPGAGTTIEFWIPFDQ